ncbi:hypothetical protein [Sulfurimonas sp. NWX367]|uniref:hypothetical protein n=1 Tax=unclassified Sulfurimonas TaxID=2623549 RepID=UPI003204CC96
MSQWIFEVYRQKESLVKKTYTRKTVLVAGSNALFGIDSRMLAKAFEMPVLNDGVNAGIELPCILHEAKKVIREGDIVIMPLEYPMYSYDGTPGMQMIDYILSREPECFLQLTLKEQFYILWHVRFQRLWDGYFHSDSQMPTTGLYGVQHINAYGDQTHTSRKERTAAFYKEVLGYAKHPQKYGAAFDTQALGWKYLTQFVQWCRQKKVTVVFMPSTLMYNSTYRQNPQERWFYEHIASEIRKRGWTFVGNPYDYMYPQEMYFNTNFHLIDAARKKRTLQMIKDLRDCKCLNNI